MWKIYNQPPNIKEGYANALQMVVLKCEFTLKTNMQASKNIYKVKPKDLSENQGKADRQEKLTDKKSWPARKSWPGEK